MAKPKRWWNGRGVLPKLTPTFSGFRNLLSNITKIQVFEICPKELFGIKRSPNNSWKGSFEIPQRWVVFPIKNNKGQGVPPSLRNCLSVNISSLSVGQYLWCTISTCIYWYIYIYLSTYLHIHMHIIFIVMCGIALCFIALYYIITCFIFPPVPQTYDFSVVGSFPREARRPSNSLLVPWRSLPWRSTDLGWVDPMLKWKMLYFCWIRLIFMTIIIINI